MARNLLRTLLFAGVPIVALALLLATFFPWQINAVGSDTTITACTEANLDTALASAQADGGGGTITFDCAAPATITFSAHKEITAPVTISSMGVLTFAGSGGNRHFYVSPTGALTLTNLALADGNPDDTLLDGGSIMVQGGKLTTHQVLFTRGFSDNGGAIYVYSGGVLMLEDTTFVENRADDGAGAMAVWDSEVHFHNVQFLGNSTQASTGGAFTANGATITGVEVEFIGNVASFGGGAFHSQNGSSIYLTSTVIMSNSAESGAGIWVWASTVQLADALVSDNVATTAGGAFALDQAGTLIVTGSRIEKNSAPLGSAFFADDGTEVRVSNSSVTENQGNVVEVREEVGPPVQMWITNTTFSKNDVGTGAALIAVQGADTLARLWLTHVTIAENVADGAAASLAQSAGDSEVFLLNTLLADEQLNSCAVPIGATFSATNSLSNDETCVGVTAFEGDAGLLPLAFNGASTLHYRLQPSSMLIDQGSAVPDLTEDQVGQPRVVPTGGAPDIGAIERQTGESPPSALNFASAANLIGPQPPAMALGVLTTLDADVDDLFDYTLLASAAPLTISPSTNVISGTVRVGAVPLPRGSYPFTAQSVDLFGNTITRTFTVTVANAAPSAPSLSPPAPVFTGTQPAGTGVGTLAATDADGDALSFAVAGSLFSAAGNQLIVGSAPLHKGTYSATVTVSDGNGGSNVATFNIVVQNAAPSAVTFAPTQPQFMGAAPVGSLVATLGMEDDDANDAATFVLLDQSGPDDANNAGTSEWFEIGGAQGNQLLVAAQGGLGIGEYTATVRATDSSGASVTGVATVRVVQTPLQNPAFLVPIQTKGDES